MNDFDLDNEIVEITDDKSNNKEEIETLEDKNEELPKREDKKQKKKNKRNIKEIWEDLDKKKKIAIIISGVILLLIIIGLIIYFVFFNKEDVKPNEPIDQVVLEEDNYRYENGKLIFLDKSNRELGTYECQNKDSNKCEVAKLDYTNDTFERVISVNENNQEIERNSQIYHDNYVFVKDGEKIFLYDIEKGNSELNLLSVKSYNTEENLVVIQDEDNKFGLIRINASGMEYLIRPSYEYLGMVNPKLAYLIAKDDDKTYLINSNGKKLSDNLSFEIKNANDKFIVGFKNNRYNLYDYDNNELENDYDYIGLHDNIISLVKASRLHLINSKQIRLTNSDGLRLNSSDYVVKYVYDKDNRLTKVKSAFEISVEDNNLTVKIDDNTKVINMNEGIVSSKLDYLSYYDGKLYFYGDKEKTELIGEYNCTNKNELKNEDDGLNNCYVYHNDNGISGIYNNQYVFIDDNKDGEKLYYLYDLKSNKVKGTYNNIEFTNQSELKESIENLYTSSSYIIARSATGSNKGNIGVLEISSGKVTGKVAFNYTNITKENDYYLLISKDNNYSIWDKEFKKISNDFAYLKLYEDYYAGVNNGKLNIYSYNNTLGILEEDLAVKNNEFTITFLKDKFKIEIDGTTYEYLLNGKPVEDENNNPTEPSEPDINEGESGEDNEI